MRAFILLIAIALAQHDHSQHLDAEFITGETLRIGQLSLNSIERHLSDYKSDMHLYVGRWKNLVDRSGGEPSSQTKDEWHEWLGKGFRNIVDRILIAKMVCDELYQSEICDMPPEINMMQLDGRGQTFREEFIDEVRGVVHSEVRKIKAYRTDL